MNNSFLKPFFIYGICILLLCIVLTPIYSYYPELFNNSSDFISFDSTLEFIWPIPDYTKITSPYGKRTSPTIRCFFFS